MAVSIHADHSSLLPPLHSPPPALTTGNGRISERQRILDIVYSTHHFSSSTCTVNDEQGGRVFNLEVPSAFKSYSVRRTLKDASSRPLLIIHHPSSKIHTFAVETEDGTQICFVQDHEKSPGEQIAQVHFGQCYETIDIRDVDASGAKTLYEIRGQPVAELIYLVHGEDALTRYGQCTLRIAAGVDVALFVALAFARIEVAQ